MYVAAKLLKDVLLSIVMRDKFPVSLLLLLRKKAAKMGWVLNASPQVEQSSEYPKIIGITVTLTVLALTIVAARLYIRWKARGMAGDDWMSALSMIFALVYSCICIARKL
jgi:hypothetical protein